MGSLKLLGLLAGWDRDGWGEGSWTKNQGGAQAKNQGAKLFFWKILHTKKKNFWAQGGPEPPFPFTWVRPTIAPLLHKY